MSMIRKEGSYGEEAEDESFSLEILNKFNETDSSTHHKGSQNAEKPKLKIQTSHESNESEDEEEEEESEDEKIEQNVIEIWKECEKVFEIVVTEKEDVTNKFLEDIASQKFEKLALLKSELKEKLDNSENEEQQKVHKDEYEVKVQDLEKEMHMIKAKGLTEIKDRFARRKMSIANKLDMESAKQKIKASLSGVKDMSFLSTPSAQPFNLSPNEVPIRKAQQLSPNQGYKNFSQKGDKILETQDGAKFKLPKTPNQVSKGAFNFNLSKSETKRYQQN